MEWTYEHIKSLWEERNSNDRSNQLTGYIQASILIGGLVGIITVILFYDRLSEINLRSVVFLIVIILISCMLQIIFHETGHLIAGLLSHYRLVSFRLLSFTFFKEDNKVRCKRYRVAGTGGQCLMIPPANVREDSCPYVLYNLGGILADIFFSILAFLSLIWISEPTLVAIIYIFGMYEAFGAIFNFFSFSGMRIQNDGGNLRAMKASVYARSSFFKQLVIYNELIKGKAFSDYSEEELFLPEKADITQPLNQFMIKILCMKYLSEQKFEQVDQLLRECEYFYADMPMSMKLYIDAERLFLLVYNCEDIRVSKTYYKNLKKRMKRNAYNLDIMRTRYCYELLIHKDVRKAQFLRSVLERCQKKSAIPQDVQLQLNLMDLVDKKYHEIYQDDIG